MPPRQGVQLFSASADSIAIPLFGIRAGLDGGGATVPYWPRFAIGCDAGPRAGLPDKRRDHEIEAAETDGPAVPCCAAAAVRRLTGLGGEEQCAARPPQAGSRLASGAGRRG